MKGNKNFLLAVVGALLTLILICLVRFVDVAPIGPEGTSIGLSALNLAAFQAFGISMSWYKITTVLGIVAILTAGLFALLGLIQLIRRKSLLKVDRELLVLAGLYVVVVILYVLFEAEMCVCDIAELLHMTQSAISHQLRVLKQSKLVKFRREGKTIYYSLADDHVRTIIGMGMEHLCE